MSDYGAPATFGDFGTPAHRVFDPSYADHIVHPGVPGYGAEHFTLAGEGGLGSQAVFIQGGLPEDELLMRHAMSFRPLDAGDDDDGMTTIL